MDTKTQLQLIELTNTFYRTHAASFSATRQSPWEGWQQVAHLAQSELVTRALIEGRAVRVTDVACGNLRFERFLTEALPRDTFAFTAIDSCDALADDVPQNVTYVHCDVLAGLLGAQPQTEDGAQTENSPLTDLAQTPADLTVCFGFMHHVPGVALRAQLLEKLVQATRPGGYIVCSYWRFMDDERLAQKVAHTEEHLSEIPALHDLDRTQLEAGDHFLGWQDDHEALRYCHHVTDPELDQLIHSLATPVEELMRFSADGKSGELNRYSVLRRR